MPVSAGPLENLTALTTCSCPYKVMLDSPLAKFHSLTTWQMITHHIRAEVTTPEPKAKSPALTRTRRRTPETEPSPIPRLSNH